MPTCDFLIDQTDVQIMAPSLVKQNGMIGSIPTAVQFSLSGSTGSSSINYDSVSPLSQCSSHLKDMICSVVFTFESTAEGDKLKFELPAKRCITCSIYRYTSRHTFVIGICTKINLDQAQKMIVLLYSSL